MLQELTVSEPRMKVMGLKIKNPQGAERQLIYATTGRMINSTMLPADAGYIVDNVETIIAVNNAVLNGKPTMERIVTVSGAGVKNPGNFKVLLGTSQNEVVKAAGGLAEETRKVISGGPMMGFSMFTLDSPITKTTSAILALTRDEVAEMEPGMCISCGRCAKACPGRLLPAQISKYAERMDEELFIKYDGMECVECGACTYTCPAKHQLKQVIGSMRKWSWRNGNFALENNITLISTNLTGRKTSEILADFEFNDDGTKLQKCAGGYKPKSCSYNLQTGQCVASFQRSQCDTALIKTNVTQKCSNEFAGKQSL